MNQRYKVKVTSQGYSYYITADLKTLKKVGAVLKDDGSLSVCGKAATVDDGNYDLPSYRVEYMWKQLGVLFPDEKGVWFSSSGLFAATGLSSNQRLAEGK